MSKINRRRRWGLFSPKDWATQSASAPLSTRTRFLSGGWFATESNRNFTSRLFEAPCRSHASLNCILSASRHASTSGPQDCAVSYTSQQIRQLLKPRQFLLFSLSYHNETVFEPIIHQSSWDHPLQQQLGHSLSVSRTSASTNLTQVTPYLIMFWLDQ